MSKRGTVPTEVFVRDTVKPVDGMPVIIVRPTGSATLRNGANDCVIKDVKSCDGVEIPLALPVLHWHPARSWLKNHRNRMQKRFDSLRQEFQQRITGILNCAADEDAVVTCCDHTLKWLEKKQ